MKQTCFLRSASVWGVLSDDFDSDVVLCVPLVYFQLSARETNGEQEHVYEKSNVINSPVKHSNKRDSFFI